MKNLGRFQCPQCKTLFSQQGEAGSVVYCPRCGTKPVAAGVKAVHPKVTVRGSYQCISCKHEFRADSSIEEKPACPACRGTNCKATSPTVMVYTGTDQKTPHENKTDRFLFDSWNMFKKLKEQCSAVLVTASGMGIPGQTLTELNRVLDKVCREAADERNKKRSTLIES